MNLVQIREQFRNISGRYDLVNDDSSDNGANFFINEGSRYLDRKVETTKSWSSYPVIKQPGTWYVRFPFARAIKEVWITTTEGRWQLEKKRLQDMISSYYADIPSGWVNGTPSFYSPTITKIIPENINPVTLATFASYIGVIPHISHEYNAIVMSTPIELEALIEIVGLFYSMELVNDTDENFWTQVHPLLLLQAAIRQTYVTAGNRPMLKTFDENIAKEVHELGMDLVEQIIAEIDQMDG